MKSFGVFSCTRKCATFLIMCVVGSNIDFVSRISLADAAINIENRPATIQEWEQIQSEPRKWFTNGGTDRNVSSVDLPLIWSPQDRPENYSIENLLNYVPATVGPTKIIIMWEDWSPGNYTRDLRKYKCLVNNCIWTTNRTQVEEADAIIFRYHFEMPTHKRPPNQMWIFNILEAPIFSLDFEFEDVFNWTSSYRLDSDIPMPYNYWYYYDQNIKFAPVAPDIATGKKSKVAWYVSNCNAANNRYQYAMDLSKYIEVDIYGRCGTKECPRSSSVKCLDMLKTNYKFYLAFENSNCKDYISEKHFFALKYDILPIVMGPPKEFYAKVSPENSFIHVDDFNSPQELATYLHKLDQNDDLYNAYFQFHGTGEFLSDYAEYPCRLCAALHSDFKPNIIEDLNEWRNQPGECSYRPQGLGLPRIPPLRW